MKNYSARCVSELFTRFRTDPLPDLVRDTLPRLCKWLDIDTTSADVRLEDGVLHVAGLPENVIVELQHDSRTGGDLLVVMELSEQPEVAA